MIQEQYLLAQIGQEMVSNSRITKKSPLYRQIENVCMIISFLSILLRYMNIGKEKYMLEVPFNIGQLLKLADMLHKQYCIKVRNKGDAGKGLPPQLIGTEILMVVSEKPSEGLNRLKERMRIYLAWAETFSGEGAGLVQWILARMAEASTKIASGTLPEKFSVEEQAQLFLGYLSVIPNTKKEEKQ